jgi:hypothetical protein
LQQNLVHLLNNDQRTDLLCIFPKHLTDLSTQNAKKVNKKECTNNPTKFRNLHQRTQSSRYKIKHRKQPTVRKPPTLGLGLAQLDEIRTHKRGFYAGSNWSPEQILLSYCLRNYEEIGYCLRRNGSAARLEYDWLVYLEEAIGVSLLKQQAERAEGTGHRRPTAPEGAAAATVRGCRAGCGQGARAGGAVLVSGEQDASWPHCGVSVGRSRCDREMGRFRLVVARGPGFIT